MKGFFKSSIGKKLIMSITGLFLITFLLVHLGLNLLILVDVILSNDGKESLYNIAANFMEVNPLMKIMQPVLGIGFVVHIFLGVVMEVKNFLARGKKRYTKLNQKKSSKWVSRNMIWLGGFIFIFLVIHIINFFWKLKFGGAGHISGSPDIHDTFELVTSHFRLWWFDIIYILGGVFLGLHLRHAFWSAFQTLGLSNDLWKKRLGVVGDLFAIIVAGGFIIIPLYFLIFEVLL